MDKNVIKEFEEKYPQMTQKFKDLFKEEYNFFIEKQLEYNISNITFNKNIDETFDIKLVLGSIISRINNKVNKLINLIIDSDYDEQTTQKLLFDIIIYSKIALLVNLKSWGK